MIDKKKFRLFRKKKSGESRDVPYWVVSSEFKRNLIDNHIE